MQGDITIPDDVSPGIVTSTVIRWLQNTPVGVLNSSEAKSLITANTKVEEILNVLSGLEAPHYKVL